MPRVIKERKFHGHYVAPDGATEVECRAGACEQAHAPARHPFPPALRTVPQVVRQGTVRVQSMEMPVLIVIAMVVCYGQHSSNRLILFDFNTRHNKHNNNN